MFPYFSIIAFPNLALPFVFGVMKRRKHEKHGEGRRKVSLEPFDNDSHLL